MSGSPDGQAEFCARVGRRLVNALALYCGDRFVAEELAQEALARALERWVEVSAMAAPEGWVYRTGVNLARSRFRRAAIERRARARLGRAPRLPDTDEVVAVRQAVLALPERQRAVIIARFYVGLDVAETAGALGCRPGTVQAHTFKALANLRAAGFIDEEETAHDRSG